MLVLYIFLPTCATPASSPPSFRSPCSAPSSAYTVVGIPANLLSLGRWTSGIIIVDRAVIVIETSSGGSAKRPRTTITGPRVRTIQEAVIEVAGRRCSSMIIIIVAHPPIFTMQRHEGKFSRRWLIPSFRRLIGLLVLSLTLVPFLSKIAFPQPCAARRNKADALVCTDIYQPLLDLGAGQYRRCWAPRCWRWPSRPPACRAGYRNSCRN